MGTLYQNSQKMLYDKEQMILASNGIAVNPQVYAEKQVSYSVFDKRLVFCPFCLIQLPICKFLIQTKKGINHLLGLCPNCKNEMQLRTLDKLVKMTMKEFTRWVFEYRLSGFWNKVTRGEKNRELADRYFREFNHNLKKFENYEDFWDYYKELKGFDDNDKNEEKEE